MARLRSWSKTTDQSRLTVTRKLVALGKVIRHLRRAKGLTRADLAKRVRANDRYIERLELGDQKVLILELLNIARALGTTTAKLMRKAKL